MQHKLFIYAFVFLGAVGVLSVQSFVTGSTIADRIGVLAPTTLATGAMSALALGSEVETRDDYMAKGLIITETRIGSGPSVAQGDTVRILFTVSTPNGIVLSSASDKTSPYVFRVGEKSVIEGLNIGVVGMQTGSTRRIVIPPEYGYGTTPPAGLAHGESLIAEVTLLAIE